MENSKSSLLCALCVAGIAFFYPSGGMATSHGKGEGMPDHGGSSMGLGMMRDGLMMPSMDPARGRVLFASKGCVVCHSVNGVGGEDASAFDASTMPRLMNPFEFSARMWRGAEAMIFLQREELGAQIELTGQDLADIIAFVHHPDEQARFSASDIPQDIKKMMHHMGEEPHDGSDEDHKDDNAFHGSRDNYD